MKHLYVECYDLLFVGDGAHATCPCGNGQNSATSSFLLLSDQEIRNEVTKLFQFICRMYHSKMPSDDFIYS